MSDLPLHVRRSVDAIGREVGDRDLSVQDIEGSAPWLPEELGMSGESGEVVEEAVRTIIAATGDDADRQGHVHKPTGQGLGRQIDERQHHERGDEEEVNRELGPRAEVKRRRGEAKRGDRRDSSLRMLPVATFR